MKINLLALLVILIMSMLLICGNFYRSIGQGNTEKELVAITQKLLDAVVSGDKAVWEKYMADSGFITEEDGVVRSKAEQLQFMRPLTAGFKRSIILTNPILKQFENTAILAIIPRERLEVGGQILNTSYNETDVFIKDKGEWKLLSSHVAEILASPVPIDLTNSQIAVFSGTYQLTGDVIFVVSVQDGKLMGQRSGRKAQVLLPETETVFFAREQAEHRRLFIKDATGQVVRMIDRRAGNDLVWTKIK
ncbi:nuclear transport factor 2 family protein [Flavitalea flava]